MAGAGQLVLYFGRRSFYSQKVRFAILEKGNVAYTPHLVDFLAHEQYSPWFLKMNPKGQIPALQHKGKVIVDSTKMIHYLDDQFGPPMLQPDRGTDYGQQVADLSEKLDSINIPILTMGTSRFHELTENREIPEEVRRVFADLEDNNVELFKKLEVEHPDIQDICRTKLKQIQAFANLLKDKENVVKAIDHTGTVLQDVEHHLETHNKGSLEKTSWLFGKDFTLADIILAITLQRLKYLGLSNTLFSKLPHISQYFNQLHQKQNFTEICLNVDSPL